MSFNILSAFCLFFFYRAVKRHFQKSMPLELPCCSLLGLSYMLPQFMFFPKWVEWDIAINLTLLEARDSVAWRWLHWFWVVWFLWFYLLDTNIKTWNTSIFPFNLIKAAVSCFFIAVSLTLLTTPCMLSWRGSSF